MHACVYVSHCESESVASWSATTSWSSQKAFWRSSGTDGICTSATLAMSLYACESRGTGVSTCGSASTYTVSSSRTNAALSRLGSASFLTIATHRSYGNAALTSSIAT